MNRFALAAALCLATGAAVAADTAPIAPPKCDPQPRTPGSTMRSEEMIMKRFNESVKAYGDCMKAYIADRQADMKANQDAANAAIADYNAVIKRLNEEAKAD